MGGVVRGRGGGRVLNFEGASLNLSLFLLVWGVLELILKNFEGDERFNFGGVFPSFPPFFLVGDVLELILEILEGGWVIDDLCDGGKGCKLIGTMSIFMSLLSMLVPPPGLADLSMSVIGTMFMCMFPLSKSKLVLHPSSRSLNLMTTFVSAIELHSLFTTCSIGG